MRLDILRVIKTVRLMAAVLVAAFVALSGNAAAIEQYSIKLNNSIIKSTVEPDANRQVVLEVSSRPSSTFSISKTGYTAKSYILHTLGYPLVPLAVYSNSTVTISCAMLKKLDTARFYTLDVETAPNTYKLNFLIDDAGTKKYVKTMVYDKVDNLPSLSKCNFAIPAGKKFVGWRGSNGRRYDDQVLVYNLSGGADFTMTALWELLQYKITLDAQGGYCPLAYTNLTYGSVYGNLPNCTRSGYRFTGWYDNKIGGSKIEPDTPLTNHSDHSLYAHWSAVTNTVYFNPEGGTVTPESKQVTYDEPYGELPTPKRPGSSFTGWYTTDGNLIESTNVVKLLSAQDLYAHWESKERTLTFNDYTNGVSVVTNLSCGSGLPIMAKPFKNEHVFFDYHDSVSNVYYDINMQVALATNVYENVTLDPNWKALTKYSKCLYCTNLVVSANTSGWTCGSEELPAKKQLHVNVYSSSPQSLLIEGVAGSGTLSFNIKGTSDYEGTSAVKVYSADNSEVVYCNESIPESWKAISFKVTKAGPLVLKVSTTCFLFKCDMHTLTWAPNDVEK